MVMIDFDENAITLSKAKELGFIPELLSDENKYGHSTFRVVNPKTTKDCKVHFAKAELFTNGHSIASFMMSEYGQGSKQYFSANINPAIVDSLYVEVFCMSNRIYKFKANPNAL